MQPMVLARLIQLAELRRGDRTLVLNAGAGYGAAVLAAMGAAVTALEDDAALCAGAQVAFARNLPEVSVRFMQENPAQPPAGLGPFRRYFD